MLAVGDGMVCVCVFVIVRCVVLDCWCGCCVSVWLCGWNDGVVHGDGM